MDQMDPKILDPLAEYCRQLLASGATQEKIINSLRKKACSKILTMRVLMMIYPLGLQQAKELVQHSPTWADRKDDDDDLHRTLERLQG